MRQLLYIILILLTVVAVGVGIAGRQGRLSRKPPIEVFPDMDRQLRLRPAQPNDFFPNGLSSQLPPRGDGNGINKKLGVMPAVANLQDKRIVEMADGEIFNIITHGKSLMGAHGPLVPVADRWAIIAYLRALQLSQLGSVDDLPPDQQAALKK
jgi:hypothetical protein